MKCRNSIINAIHEFKGYGDVRGQKRPYPCNPDGSIKTIFDG